MRKKIIINVIYENEKMNTVQDTVTIPANNLFTNGMLNDLGKQKVSNGLYGLLDHAGAGSQIGIEVEGSRFDDESNDYIKSNSVTVFVLSPEERLLLMIFKEINKSVIKDINSMNASVEESLKEIKVEEIKGEKE